MVRKVAVLFMACCLIFIAQQPSWSKSRIVRVGYGSSIQPDTQAAVKEATASIKAKLGRVRPDFVFLFSTVGYDMEQLLAQVKADLGKNVKIYGGTSCLAVFTKDGFHQGEKTSLAMLAVSTKKMKFGVGGATLTDRDACEAGKEAVLEAIKDAGKKQDNPPDLILITAAPGLEEKIIDGIESVVGNDVPIIGGSSADNTIEGNWLQFANGEIYANGLSLAVIYTDLKIGISYQSGYDRTTKTGVITKAEGRVIYEIDNKPAADVYNKWVEGELNDVLKTGGTILHRTSFCPLAKVVKGYGDIWFFLAVHPLSFNLPERSLTVFADTQKGDTLELMRGDWEVLLNRAYSSPKLALRRGGLDKEDVVFGIFNFCAGSMLAIPENERSKIPLLANKALEDTPYIGTFTFGEQGHVAGVGNLHGNLVSSMILFSDIEK